MYKVLVFAALCCCYCVFAGTFYPRLEVATNVTLDWGRGPFDLYLVVNGDDILYMKEYHSPTDYTLIRCDLQNNGCYQKKYDDESDPKCEEYYSPATSILDDIFPDVFDYVGKPQPIDCPEGVSGKCMSYSDDDGISIIADSTNRVYQVTITRDSEVQIHKYTYHDDHLPTVESFADNDCDGSPLPDPKPFGSFRSLDLCAASVSYGEKGRLDTHLAVFWQGESVMYAQIKHEKIIYTMRCDEKDDNDECYAEYYDAGSDPACLDPSGFPIDYLINTYIPRRFGYVGEPETVKCTEDGSEECTKYTNMDGLSYVVDSFNHVVKLMIEHDSVDILHHDTPSVDIFDDLKCNSTALPPAVNPCAVDPSSSSPSSSSSSSPSSGSTSPSSGSSASPSSTLPQSSTKPDQSPSSASIIKVMMSIVAATLIVALL